MKSTIFLVIWCCLIRGSNNELQYEDTFMTKFGILVHKSNVVVIVDRDSLVIKIVYDTQEIRLFWNDFLEKGDALLQYIGMNNECVNRVLLDARTSREKIRIWSNNTLGSVEILEREHKAKRQAVLIGGVASLLALGLTEWQISKINNRISEMQTDVSHNDENIQLLGKAVKFNSKKLRQ